MADINQVITLGIGTPSGIPEFLTLGLQIGEAVAVGVIAGFGEIVSPSSFGAVESPDATGTIESDRYG
jgi:hypothetical protein